MASELKRTGQYRLLYYQPAPETGERITIGLLLDDGIQPIVHCDWQFKKVLRLYPWVDPKILAVYLTDLSQMVGKQRGPVEEVVQRLGPQLTASAPRQFALPLTSMLVDILLEKFVNVTTRERPEGTVKADPVAMAIEAFVKNRSSNPTRIRTGIGPETILGRKVGRLGSVAVGIESATGWTLIDGVDLNVLTPGKAIARADDVGRTFWQYSRLAAESHGRRIRTIGLVMNGRSHLKPGTHDAHDYALHRLQADSDAAIDTASTEASARLNQELAAVDRP